MSLFIKKKMNPDETCVDVANYLKENYFKVVNSSEFAQFYSNSSIIYYENKEFQGKKGASNFSSEISKFSFRVTGFNAQKIPGSDVWSVVTLTGTVKTENVHTFISTFHVEVNAAAQKGLIFYQTLSIL